MQPRDIFALVNVHSPCLSPDGRLAAFVVGRIDEAANAYRSQVWLAPVDGEWSPEPFSNGAQSDGGPCWSPDGRRLAFTSTLDDKRTTLHVRPVAGGGETVTLSSLPESMVGLAWSADGRWIAFGARARTDRYDHGDERRQPPRRITRFFSRLNDEGWTVDRPAHVWVVPADGSGPARDLTPGEFAFAHPAWAPDSRHLVVDGAAHATWDLDLAQDIYLLGLDGSGPQRLTTGGANLSHGSWSPDGGRVAFVGYDDPLSEPQNGRVGVVELAGGQRRWLSTYDRTHAPYPDAIAPIWRDDALLSLVEDGGAVQVRGVALDGVSDERLVVGGARCVTGVSVAGDVIAFTATTSAEPAELFVAVDGEERRITGFGESFVHRVQPTAYQRFGVPSSNGSEIDAWMVTPPSFDDSERYPALLMIHGGPFTQYGESFFDEAQLYAAAGYVVLLSNPRGSSGRDTGWGRAIAGPKDPRDPGQGWGSVDYDDVMGVVDEALRRYPFVDDRRLGVLGGSYGGYLTSWIVSHGDRFAAACSERAVNNLLSLEWSSDMATVFRTEMGVSHLEDPGEYLAHSPITFASRINTPLLIIHSEDDLRCPIEQAEQLFVALRMQGKPVEFLRFPGESHELSRSGSPIHRVQRAEAILDFFGRHLSPGGRAAGRPRGTMVPASAD